MCNNRVREYPNLADNIGFDISDRASSAGIRDKHHPPASFFMVAVLNDGLAVTSTHNNDMVSWHASLLNKEDAICIYNALAGTKFARYLRRIA